MFFVAGRNIPDDRLTALIHMHMLDAVSRLCPHRGSPGLQANILSRHFCRYQPDSQTILLTD